MSNTILCMYITLMPTLLSGILTMIWCRLPFFGGLKKPMDGGKNWIDQRRIFGDHKTWHGAFGYLLTNVLTAICWGEILKRNLFLLKHNYFYFEHENTILYNLLLGILLGLAYVLFELPNSFLKRRYGILPGKRGRGARGLFVILDQIDSIAGCALAVWIFYDIGWGIFCGFLFLGALTHLIVNIMLYFLKLRKNIL
ncbi:MAG: CDP-archaeol synthase [Johnsonella sp.]|nr:CDP-archaeol synthase [Johnsonella sp.]